ncbi:MAG: flagellin [Pseudomonadota bacterium]
MSSPALTSAVRANLNSLQSTADLLGRTQERLATGLKVNSALDNPNAFFAAKGLEGRANDLGFRLEKLGQDISTIQAATQATETIEGLLQTVKAKITEAAALGTDTAGLAARVVKQTEANALIAQARAVAEDAGYGGVNLLNNEALTSVFNEAGDNTLATAGVDYTTAATSIVADFATGFNNVTNTDAATTAVNAALASVRTQAGAFSTNLTIISAREDFTKNIIGTLEQGAGKLTLADTNEESANLLALQTRQQLGVTALSLSAQADQSVLRLF